MTKILDSIQYDSGPNPTASIIFIHGLGDSGHGWSDFARYPIFDGIGPISFVFPHANNMPVTLNNGMMMPSWYDIDLTQREREDEAGLRASQAQIEALIAREKARGIPAGRIILAGFSQGCAMALQTGLRHPETLAGLMCLSGYVPLSASVPTERSKESLATPIFMVHGIHDGVIPIARASQSRDLLRSMGYQVEWHEYTMQHSLCQEEVDHISAWLKKVLPAA